MIRKSFLTLFLSLMGLSNSAWAGLFGNELILEGIELEGAGCPAGSVSAQVARDGSSFTILYDRFILEGLASSARNEISQDCQVKLRVHKPRLMGFSIQSVDLRGFVQLDPGVRAAEQVKVTSGATDFVRNISADFGFERWIGPLAQNYTLSTIRSIQRPAILNCLPIKERTQIIVKTKLRLMGVGAGRSGLLAVDSADGRMAQRFNIKWDNCIQAGGELGGILGDLFGGR